MDDIDPVPPSLFIHISGYLSAIHATSFKTFWGIGAVVRSPKVAAVSDRDFWFLRT